MRYLRPLRSSTDLISLRNHPPICAPVLPRRCRRCCSPCRTRSSARRRRPVHPGGLAGARSCRTAGRCRRRRSDPCRHSSRRQYDPFQPCRSAPHRAPAGRARSRPRRRADLELVVGRLGDVLGEGLAGAVQRVERLGEARGQAPFQLRHRLRDGRRGKRAYRRNSAVPSAAVRRNLRRCMCSSQELSFVCQMVIPLSGISLPFCTRHAQKKAPPKRGFSRAEGRAQSLLPADWRAMKLSKVFSTTRNHSTSSLRNVFQFS